MKLNWVAGLSLCVLVGLLSGCRNVSQNQNGVRTACSDELRIGDFVTFTFSDLPPPGMPEHRERIRTDGAITLPLVGAIQAAGKKIGELQRDVHALYVPKYYRQITITVKVEDRFFSVGGEVRSPARLPFIGEITVLRAIQSAGDFNEFADRRKVVILRANGDREVVDCIKARRDPKKYDLVICPGDSIHVPRTIL